MSNKELDQAFNLIYRSFSQHGRHIVNDQDRHPEHTANLLDSLGRPDRNAANILVTGSKGKGSTALYTAALWETLARPVGLFTSPHLLDTLERIRVNRTMISEPAFERVFDRLVPDLTRILEQLPPGQYVGPVGIFAALAAWHFHEQKVAGAVYETGRGARFDDVARVFHPTAVITTILPEHLRELGGSLETVAWHKAGAICPETTLVVLGSDSELLRRAVDTRVHELGTDPVIQVAPHYVELDETGIDDQGAAFTLTFRDGRRWADCRIPAIGAVVNNVATAVTAVELALGRVLSEAATRPVLASLAWPGRGEVLKRRPFTLLDAGVRPESIRGLLIQSGPFDRILLSIPDGKDQMGMAHEALRYAREVYVTGCSNPRLTYHFDTLLNRERITVIPDVGEALAAIHEGIDADTRLFLCGTISFVADVYRYFGRTP